MRLMRMRVGTSNRTGHLYIKYSCSRSGKYIDFRKNLDNCFKTSGSKKNVQFRKFEYHSWNVATIGSYREIAIAIESEAGDSIDQSGFSRKERNLHCDVHATYTSPLKTNTYCRRSGRQTRCG